MGDEIDVLQRNARQLRRAMRSTARQMQLGLLVASASTVGGISAIVVATILFDATAWKGMLVLGTMYLLVTQLHARHRTLTESWDMHAKVLQQTEAQLRACEAHTDSTGDPS